MSTWPDEVESYYAELAARRGWSAETQAAIRATVELVRNLDLGTSARTYGQRRDEDGTSYLFQAAWQENEWVVVRQIERRADGRTIRYWWQHLEDDEGMLADKALDRDAWGLTDLTREQFYAVWDAV